MFYNKLNSRLLINEKYLIVYSKKPNSNFLGESTSLITHSF